MKGLSGSVEDGRFVIAATARKKVTLFDVIRRGRFLPYGWLGISPELPQRVSCLRFHIPSVPYCVVRPLGCVMVYFN